MITFSDQCRLYFNKYYLNNRKERVLISDTIECMFYKYEHYNLIIWHKLLFLSLTIFYANFTLCFQIQTDCSTSIRCDSGADVPKLLLGDFDI